MRFAISVAALAGAAIASPYAGYPQKDDGNVVVEVTTVIKTVYVTEGYETAQPTPTPSPVYEAPVYETVTSVYEAPPPPPPAPTSEKYEEAPAPAEPTYEAAPPPAPEPSPAAPPASNEGYMAVVNEWRGKLGMPALTQDSKLESNALNTVVSSNGQMIHKLNAGTFAQVLAPGKLDNTKDFEHVFVGGWLCELPNLAGLGASVCDQQSIGWTYQGQTGHAEILTSKNYNKIGCAEASGIVCCDLA